MHCRGWPGGYERLQSIVSACGPWRSYTVTIEGEAVIPTVVHDLGNGRYKVTYIPYSPGRTLPGTEGCAQGHHACSRLDRAALCGGRKAQSRRRGWQGRIKSWCRCGSNPGADVGRRAFRSATDRRTSPRAAFACTPARCCGHCARRRVRRAMCCTAGWRDRQHDTWHATDNMTRGRRVRRVHPVGRRGPAVVSCAAARFGRRCVLAGVLVPPGC